MATKKSTTATTEAATAETAATETVEAVQVEATETTKEETKFSLENLAKNCRPLFGVSSCTFAGATAGLTGEYTVSEMKSIIKKWCGKEIK
ncbi:MAG: hypothetical protein LIO54_08545 [Oscillospiraceae bacterium]|nr:hypothetical protein [Oscillospiraceae bacterium]